MSNVQDQVLNALHWDFALPRGCVAVKFQEGWVTLTGQVDQPYQRSCAEADVLRVPGVVGVHNEIVVRPPKAPARH
jgi:osmotically-inducible protein OsmY